MIIDTAKIEALLFDDAVSYDQIMHQTGMSKGAIYPYRKRKRSIMSMTLATAQKLQTMHDELHGAGPDPAAVEIEKNQKGGNI